MQRPPKEPATNNPFDLPEDRLATTTEEGKRVYLYPARVKGWFRQRRSWVYRILMLIFLGLPWVKIQGDPVILLDVVHRKFVLFGTTFWAHEAPILVLVFLTFILAISLVTALWGRVWCGWACPQTVFIDTVFRPIEEFLEGNGLARKRFDSRPFSMRKLGIKTLKWGLFTAASLVITHSFLAYFVGADSVLQMIQGSPKENFGSFLVVLISTAIILFDFGWFREQFCIIACPYGRFQSVIMDEHSLVVGYDYKRGEPRKKDRKDETATGDCINCYRCVQVCPTGIDIRRGTQMECIACTACIDACDHVMRRLEKPTGLIRMGSENSFHHKVTHFWRLRAWIYLSLLSIVLLGLSYALSTRDMLSIFASRSSSPPYTMVAEHTVQNHFKLSIRNQYEAPIDIAFSLADSVRNDGYELFQPLPSIRLAEGAKVNHSVFIRFPQSELSRGRADLPLLCTVKMGDGTWVESEALLLVGPN